MSACAVLKIYKWQYSVIQSGNMLKTNEVQPVLLCRYENTLYPSLDDTVLSQVVKNSSKISFL